HRRRKQHRGARDWRGGNRAGNRQSVGRSVLGLRRWNNVTYIAGEIRQPQRVIPRGLIYGMATVITVYILTNLAYLYVLPMEEMAGSKLVAADVASKFFEGGDAWIAAAVMISTFGTTNGTILASARVYFSMARQNVFPRFLGNAHPRFHTPGASLVVQCVWSVALLFSGSFDTLTDMLIFVSWIFLRRRCLGGVRAAPADGGPPAPYRVPGFPVVPAIFVVFAVLYLGLTIYNDLNDYAIATAAGQPAVIKSVFGLALVAVGLPVYWYYRKRSREK
ncbi:MAG: amino acid permease-associated region, partial [Chlorobi bacterium OLB7]